MNSLNRFEPNDLPDVIKPIVSDKQYQFLNRVNIIQNQVGISNVFVPTELKKLDEYVEKNSFFLTNQFFFDEVNRVSANIFDLNNLESYFTLTSKALKERFAELIFNHLETLAPRDRILFYAKYEFIILESKNDIISTACIESVKSFIQNPTHSVGQLLKLANTISLRKFNKELLDYVEISVLYKMSKVATNQINDFSDPNAVITQLLNDPTCIERTSIDELIFISKKVKLKDLPLIFEKIVTYPFNSIYKVYKNLVKQNKKRAQIFIEHFQQSLKIDTIAGIVNFIDQNKNYPDFLFKNLNFLKDQNLTINRFRKLKYTVFEKKYTLKHDVLPNLLFKFIFSLDESISLEALSDLTTLEYQGFLNLTNQVLGISSVSNAEYSLHPGLDYFEHTSEVLKDNQGGFENFYLFNLSKLEEIIVELIDRGCNLYPSKSGINIIYQDQILSLNISKDSLGIFFHKYFVDLLQKTDKSKLITFLKSAFNPFQHTLFPETKMVLFFQFLKFHNPSTFETLRNLSNYEFLLDSEILNSIILTLGDCKKSDQDIEYYIGKKISEGGLGKVFYTLMTSKRTAQSSFAALKLSHDIPGALTVLQYDIQRMKTTEQWNDPHILRLLHSGYDFMILESGANAQDLCSSIYTLSAKDYMLSLINCLASIQTFWDNGYYHADLKPLNLLTFQDFNTSELQARVIDISPMPCDVVIKYKGGTPDYRFPLPQINQHYNKLMQANTLTEAQVTFSLAIAQDIKAIGECLKFALYYHGGHIKDPNLINELHNFIKRTQNIDSASEYQYMRYAFQKILLGLHQTFIKL